jgi:hypothetical protein
MIMSYDFSFARLTPRPEVFPVTPTVGGNWRVEALHAPQALEKFLIESGQFRPNGAIGDIRFYRWAMPEGGSLDVCIVKKSVDVGVHTHWRYVAELYALLLPLEEGLLIADNQTGVFYDAAAFDTFIEESYAKDS